jgi:DNA-binding MarR family transcriptional regulator
MAISEDAAFELVVSLHRLLRSLSKERPDRTLQPTQLIVLALLTEYGPSRIGVLAEWVPCSQPTATSVVVGLETAGLVCREPDPTDGRATRVAITPEGSTALGIHAHSESEALAERLGALPPGEAEKVLAVGRILRHLADTALNSSEPTPGPLRRRP